LTTMIFESDRKIAWIINYRSDNRFKVSKSSKKVVKLVTK
jgi:hypothetical protein